MSAEVWFASNGNVSCRNNIYGCCENPHAVHNFPCMTLNFALVYSECKPNHRIHAFFLRNNEFLLLFSANFDIILPRCPYLNLCPYYFEGH